jgi:hypothetical protein
MDTCLAPMSPVMRVTSQYPRSIWADSTRPCGDHARLADFHRCERVVEILLGDRPLLGERRQAGDILLVFVESGIGLGQRSIGGGESFHEGFLIELEQQVALFDLRALGE